MVKDNLALKNDDMEKLVEDLTKDGKKLRVVSHDEEASIKDSVGEIIDSNYPGNISGEENEKKSNLAFANDVEKEFSDDPNGKKETFFKGKLVASINNLFKNIEKKEFLNSIFPDSKEKLKDKKERVNNFLKKIGVDYFHSINKDADLYLNKDQLSWKIDALEYFKKRVTEDVELTENNEQLKEGFLKYCDEKLDEIGQKIKDKKSFSAGKINENVIIKKKENEEAIDLKSEPATEPELKIKKEKINKKKFEEKFGVYLEKSLYDSADHSGQWIYIEGLTSKKTKISVLIDHSYTRVTEEHLDTLLEKYHFDEDGNDLSKDEKSGNSDKVSPDEKVETKQEVEAAPTENKQEESDKFSNKDMWKGMDAVKKEEREKELFFNSAKVGLGTLDAEIDWDGYSEKGKRDTLSAGLEPILLFVIEQSDFFGGLNKEDILKLRKELISDKKIQNMLDDVMSKFKE